MNNMDNLQSYDKVEYYQAHELSDEELHKYCSLKMETAQPNLEFIEKEIFSKGGGVIEPLDICEIGGGNGKLLFSLEKRGLLRTGINYEISQSRCDLAKRFAKLLSCSNVEIRNCNFLDDETKKDQFDCIIMVDIVWQLISPLYDFAQQDMLRWLRTALKQDGYLFIEIIDYSDVMQRIEKEGILRTWIEFPEGDPFQYSLDKFSIDPDNNLVCEKFFIGRNNHVRDYFKNVIRSYSKEEITQILTKNGFDSRIYPCYDETLPEIERNSTFRILAKKLS